MTWKVLSKGLLSALSKGEEVRNWWSQDLTVPLQIMEIITLADLSGP